MSSTTPSATRNSASLDRLQVENGRSYSAGPDLTIFLISRCSTHPVICGKRDLRDRGQVHPLSGQQQHLRPPPGHHRPSPPRTIRTSRRPSRPDTALVIFALVVASTCC